MAGAPVTNPLSQPGPPRLPGDAGLEFYNSGAMQPGSFPSSGHFQPSAQQQSGSSPLQPMQLGQPAQPMQPSQHMQPMQPMHPMQPQPGAGFAGVGQPSVFTPQQPSSYDDDFENEPPLLEELGIDVGNIWLRMKGIAFFKKLEEEVLRDADLGGPIVIILSLGLCLLLAGKLVLGLLYGWGLTSCIFICLLINVMSQRGGIDLYCTTSILGYGLIPIVLLAFIGIFVSLKSTVGTVISMICIFWATATSSRFFATAIAMHQQRWLVAYPVGLVYTLVSLITVF